MPLTCWKLLGVLLSPQFIWYALRWQCSTPVLYLTMILLYPYFGTLELTVIANGIGACLFYGIDSTRLFLRKEKMTNCEIAWMTGMMFFCVLLLRYCRILWRMNKEQSQLYYMGATAYLYLRNTHSRPFSDTWFDGSWTANLWYDCIASWNYVTGKIYYNAVTGRKSWGPL